MFLSVYPTILTQEIVFLTDNVGTSLTSDFFMPTFKKIISMLCCWCLLISSSPMTVLANESAEEQDGESRTFDIETKGENTYEGEDAVTLLSLIAIGLFVASLWRYKPMTKDMWIATSAGVLLVAAEIMALAMTREKISDKNYKLVKNEDGSTNNLQTDALREQNQSYKDLEKLAKIKWKIQLAASAAFFTAAGFAYHLHGTWNSKRVACSSTMVSTGCKPAIAAHTSQESIILVHGKSSKKVSKLNALQTKKLAALKACTGAALAATPVSTPLINSLGAATKACTVEATVQQSVLSAESAKIDGVLSQLKNSGPDDPNKVLKTVITGYKEPVTIDYIQELASELMDIFVPRAHSLKLSMLGLGVVATGIVMKLMKFKIPILDRSMAVPLHRGIAFTAAGVLAGGGSALSKKLEGQMGDNKEKIDSMIHKMENELQGAPIRENGEGEENQKIEGNILAATEEDGVPIDVNGEPFPCPEGLKQGNGSCKEIVDGGKLWSFKEPPAALTDMGAKSKGLADSIIGSTTLSSGDLATAGELGSQAAIAKRRARKVAKFLDKKNEEWGIKKTGHEKLTERMLASINDANSKVGKNSSGGLLFAGKRESLNKNDEATEREPAGVKNNSAIAAASNNSKKVRDRDEKEDEEEVYFGDYGFEEESSAEYKDGKFVVSIKDKGLDTRGTDIVKQRDRSIFEVITRRYMISGYPRLLNEIKPDEQEARKRAISELD